MRSAEDRAARGNRIAQEERFWAKIQKTETCWLWTACRNRNGYGSFQFDGEMRGAHRISWEMANGPIPDGLQLDHLCRVRHCVNPQHLEPVTPLENSRRGLCVGNTWAQGEKSGSAKLTEAQVLAIRADRRSQRAIASAYGVTHALVGLIKRRQKWRHLKEPA